MTTRDETADQPWTKPRAPGAAPIPGLVLVFAGGRPCSWAMPLSEGRLELGRGMVAGIHIDDPCMSRKHAVVSRDGDVWRATDLDSRNGSAIDGAPLKGTVERDTPSLLRTGDTLFLFSNDVRPFQMFVAKRDSIGVVGPTLAAAFEQISAAATGGDILHVVGETGSGKELAARAFHRGGPFVAVNCAAVPHGLAERLFFGAIKGAFSGADHDAGGYIQEARGGTLFLDEIAELDPLVQPKLLRVLESREVLALGAARAEKIDLRICSATHRDLRAAVASGKFREDLYFRIGSPSVRLPPLRERREDIAPLLQLELSRADPELSLHVSFVESCLARPWPGNVRELFLALRTAAQCARIEKSETLEARFLPTESGAAIDHEAPRAAEPARSTELTRDALIEVLTKSGGNIARAARTLGLHRNQLRRLLAANAIDAKQFRA